MKPLLTLEVVNEERGLQKAIRCSRDTMYRRKLLMRTNSSEHCRDCFSLVYITFQPAIMVSQASYYAYNTKKHSPSVYCMLQTIIPPRPALLLMLSHQGLLGPSSLQSILCASYRPSRKIPFPPPTSINQSANIHPHPSLLCPFLASVSLV